MAHTYAGNFVHCVFSTKGRRPLLSPQRAEGLYAYFSGIAQAEGLTLITAGGTSNHVHLLFVLPAPCALARAVQKLKGKSSIWLGRGFSWQEGYGAFSVSSSQAQVVKEYIRNQEQHHRKRDFEQEFVALLRKSGIAYDEKYVFG